MYSSKKDKKSLHEQRFFNFQKSALKGSLKLENLPPTEGATKQHGYKKDPTARLERASKCHSPSTHAGTAYFR